MLSGFPLFSLRYALIAALIVLQLSCKKDDIPEEPAAENILRFTHVIAGEPLQFNQLTYPGPDSLFFSVQTLRYFISDLRFEDCCGEKFILDSILYIDAVSRHNTQIQYPVGDLSEEFTQLCFTFGLKEEINQHGLFSTLPEIAMEWPLPMGGGYHYMKLEGKYDNGTTIHNYHIHTGMLDGVSRHIDFCLPLHQSVSLNRFDLSLVMDIGQWLENPHPFSLQSIAGGMMSNHHAQQLIYENGASVFSLIQP